jgi:hypothetical protein
MLQTVKYHFTAYSIDLTFSGTMITHTHTYIYIYMVKDNNYTDINFNIFNYLLQILFNNSNSKTSFLHKIIRIYELNQVAWYQDLYQPCRTVFYGWSTMYQARTVLKKKKIAKIVFLLWGKYILQKKITKRT